MPIYHIFLVLLVVTIWGLNFTFIKFALHDLHPLFLCSVRFFLASFPAVFFIKRPVISFKIIALYGLVMFGLQFAFLFMSMHVGMTPGMASLLIQVQVFFSIFFAVIFLNEAPSLWQSMGALISFSGIALVAFHLDKNISLAGFVLMIAAAAAWGVGNLITKKISHVNVIALVVWGSLVACLPLFLLSLIFEGADSIANSIQHISWLGFFSILYIVYLSTWVGYGVWNWLLRRYHVAMVVPFTLLVPIVGMLGSAIAFNEPLQSWKLIAGLLVISGLCVNLLGAYFTRSHRSQTSQNSCDQTKHRGSKQ